MNRDRLALTALSNCGFVTKTQLNNYIKDNRINSYIKEKLIVKSIHVDNKNNSVTAYKLTNKGKEVLTKNFGVTNHYSARSISHDIKLSNRYFTLSEKEQATWRTESHIRDLFNTKMEQIREQDLDRYREITEQKISMPDCSYTLETGIEVYFEVITINYTQSDIEAKERTFNILKESNSRYETTR